MTQWHRYVFPLKENHNWKISPGNKVLMTDQGAVRFEYPQSWIVDPEQDTVKLRDRPEPNDNCLLQVTVMYLAPRRDWSGLELDFLVADSAKIDEREIIARGKICTGRRAHLAYAWQEARAIDPTEKREVISRFCLARSGIIQLVITMDYWPEYAAQFRPVWDNFLATLRLGEYIADPFRQPLN